MYVHTYVPVSHYVCVANMSSYHVLLFPSGSGGTNAAATATTAATAATATTAATAATASTSINAQPSSNPKNCAKDAACQTMTNDETGNDTAY